MGGGGPMITGSWINTRTGETVTVRDSFMDGDDMVIFLTDGRQLTLADFQDYVQQSEEEYDEHGNIVSNTNGGGIQTPKKPHHQPAKVDAATVFAGMDEKDTSEAPVISDADGLADLQAVMQNDGSARVSTAPVKKTASEGLEAALKIIRKSKAPQFKVVVDWNEFPKDELVMAKKFFDTTDDDIAKAIISTHCSGHELEAALTEWLVNEMRK